MIMNRRWQWAAGLAVWSAIALPAWTAGIDLVGVGSVPGSAVDKSGLTGTINGAAGTIPQNLLGAFGSGIAYTGFGNRYIAVNDRGFSDGVTTPSYKDRFQVFDISVNPTTKTISPTLVDTRFFTNESGQNFAGQSSAFNTVNPAQTLRFDPEGVRAAPNGHLFVSDEYGPYIHEFNQQGQQVRTINIPDKYKIANPNADASAELSGNTIGRQTNRGLEGLAITPDGKTLYASLQNPLLQDGALDSSGDRVGVNSRILKVDLETGKTEEFVYQLDSGKKNGINEILAINDHEFLVLERDGKAGTEAKTKQIFKIDITDATDVSDIGNHANDGLPEKSSAGFIPVSKELFLDLLNPAYGLAGDHFPEKLEGLTWGPDLGDGRRLLLVTSDNDLIESNPSQFYAFGIDPSLLPGFDPQRIDVPFTVTPEPGSMALLAAGGLLLLVRRKRA